MGLPVTPSPTPPADGQPGLSPSPQAARRIANSVYGSGMCASDIGPWRYTTPPFDERPMYTHTPQMSPSMPHLSVSSDSNALQRLSNSSPLAIPTQAWDAHGHYIPGIRDTSPVPGHSTRHLSPDQPGSLRSRSQQGRLKRARATSEDNATPQLAKLKRKQQLNVPVLERSLSKYALDYRQVKVDDIEAYVNRSLDERRREASVAGKIKRELNPFLLYRKAHKSVAEELIRNNSNDTSHINPRISKLCGVSWKHLEPPEVKSQYETWSKIEKDRLKEAFPEYRYQPNKRQRTEEQELPAFTDAYGPPGDYGSQCQSQRDFTPDRSGFGQATPPRRDETLWLRECGSPSDALSLGFPTQHLAGAYIEDPFQLEHERSPIWGVPRDPMMLNHSWSLTHQDDLFKVQSTSKMPSIDPKLYYDGSQEFAQYPDLFQGSAHVPPGQYLLSAPPEAASSRGPSPEPLGQSWASSIPGNGGVFDYLTGNLDGWELGADSDAPI